MASIPITSRKRDGKVEKRKDKKMDIVADFIFLSSKITAYSDCSHEIKRHLFFGRKTVARQCVKKQRYHFADLGHMSNDFHMTFTFI